MEINFKTLELVEKKKINKKKIDSIIKKVDIEPQSNNKKITLIIIFGLVLISLINVFANKNTINKQIAEAVYLSNQAKEHVESHYGSTGELPIDNASMGFYGLDGEYISGVGFKDGYIEATFNTKAGKQLSGKFVKLKPSIKEDSEKLNWNCETNAEEIKDKICNN